MESGILMISAALLGAWKLVGVDENEVAVNICRDNLRLNKVPEETFHVKIGNLVRDVDDRFDVVAANILSEVILVLLDDVEKVLAKNGVFICSGIAEGNSGAVIEKMKAMGLDILEVTTREQWVSISCRKNRD